MVSTSALQRKIDRQKSEIISEMNWDIVWFFFASFAGALCLCGAVYNLGAEHGSSADAMSAISMVTCFAFAALSVMLFLNNCRKLEALGRPKQSSSYL